jgi:hypothetical protein
LPTEVGFGCLDYPFSHLAAFAGDVDIQDIEQRSRRMTLKLECGHPLALSARLALLKRILRPFFWLLRIGGEGVGPAGLVRCCATIRPGMPHFWTFTARENLVL